MKDERFQSLRKKTNAKLRKIMRISPHRLERCMAYGLLVERQKAAQP